MTKKLISVAIAIVMTLSMGLMLTSCGDKFDAAAYVRASLDAFKTGEISDDLVKMSSESKEELQAQVDSIGDELEGAVLTGIDDKYITDDMRADARRYATEMCSAIKYEVLDDADFTDEVYTVKLNVYPMTSFNDWMDNESAAVIEEWTEKAANYTSQDDLFKDFYPALTKELADYFSNPDNIKYGDAKEFAVKLEKNADGNYEPNQADLEAAFTAMFGM